ncbi:MAG: hypothetical protein FD157_3380 [Rhodocyclaceae bacterium]|nr:MAG: hypothetical protein FD157_3380 [Rhodocyclaceae bacterium]TNC99404.1 MAG: hypothetical protein FD118_3774 [Rhodocyclaceae bacterium]
MSKVTKASMFHLAFCHLQNCEPDLKTGRYLLY